MALNEPAYVWPTQSTATHSVKMVVYLRKRSHNRLFPRLCKKLRNKPTSHRSFTQRLVSWSSPVVPKVWIKIQRRVEKGQKMGHAEAIQTGVADFQRYHQGQRRGRGAVTEFRAMESCKKQKNRNRLCLFLHSNNVDLKHNSRNYRKPFW